MRRDMAAVRDLLLRIEGGESEISTTPDTVESQTRRQLKDAGYITSDTLDAFPLLVSDGERWAGLRLSWTGADYIEKIRDGSAL